MTYIKGEIALDFTDGRMFQRVHFKARNVSG